MTLSAAMACAGIAEVQLIKDREILVCQSSMRRHYCRSRTGVDNYQQLNAVFVLVSIRRMRRISSRALSRKTDRYITSSTTDDAPLW